MQLTDQVITFEQSYQLKELGFNKESLYLYRRHNTGSIISEMSIMQNHKGAIGMFDLAHIERTYAYTVSELMEYLPDTIKGYKRKIYLNKNQYKITYDVDINSNGGELFTSNDNLAQALGDMLIYLISNNYLNE